MITSTFHETGFSALLFLQNSGSTGSAHWAQGYDPTHHWWLSTAWAALPLLVLLTTIVGFKLKAHRAALLALATAFAIAVFVFHMPVILASLAAAYGAGYGLFPIFWIIFPVIFMYHLTVKAGRFVLLQQCMTDITEDSRLQLLLIAFCLGAFFEGAAGFGTPVAVCGTILLGLGFKPVQAAGLALLANTAPVAFGGLGIPIIALHGVTGLDTLVLTRVVAVLLTPFCILVPFWLIWAYAGFKAMLEVWPAIFVAGVTFAFTQLMIARLHGPWLVDIIASVVTITALVLFLRVWKPKRILNAKLEDVTHLSRGVNAGRASVVFRAALPWIILTMFVTLWGAPKYGAWVDGLSTIRLHVPGLDRVVSRMPPAVPKAAAEPAVFVFNWISATGRRHFSRCSARRLRHGSPRPSGGCHVDGNRQGHAVYDGHHRRAHGSWIRDALLRNGRDPRAGLCAHWPALSIFRNVDWVAWHGVDRVRYLVQRSLRKPSEAHRPAVEHFAVHHGGGQFRRWRDGQNGRSAERGRRQHCHRHLWQGREHPSLRLAAQSGARVPDGLARFFLYLLSGTYKVPFELIRFIFAAGRDAAVLAGPDRVLTTFFPDPTSCCSTTCVTSCTVSSRCLRIAERAALGFRAAIAR